MDPLSQIALDRVIGSAFKLVETLMTLRSLQKHNPILVQDITEFITSLNSNIELLKRELPGKSNPWAFESLQAKLEKVREDLEKNLDNFKRFWNAKQIKEKLEKLQKDILNEIQVTHFVTTLEVAINADQKMTDFQSKMMEYFAMSTAHNHTAVGEIRALLKPLVAGMRWQDQRLKSFKSQVQGHEFQVETSSEMQKFSADVLANLKDLTEEEKSTQRAGEDETDDYLDPFTRDLMNDPVKCTDGHTYDRFSVLKHNLYPGRAPLRIACDDLDMRRRLFQKFPEAEARFSNERASYRNQALTLANEGHSAEALRMLENVLQWAPNDAKLLELRQKLEQERAYRPPFVAHQNHQAYTPPVYTEGPPQGTYDRRDRVWGILKKRLNPSEMGCLIYLMICFPCVICCLPCIYRDTIEEVLKE